MRFYPRKHRSKRPGKLTVAAATDVAAVAISHRLYIFDKKSHLKFLIDSGSDVSCLPVTDKTKNLKPDSLELFAANNSKIRTYGTKLINVDLGLRRNFNWKFLIADVPTPIIGAGFFTTF